MNFQKNILALVLLFSVIILDAQDYHFTQYQLSPLNINPAMSGYMDVGNHRISLKYRDQWSSILGANSYQTGQFSYDGRICKNKNFLAFGANVVMDRVGLPEIQTNNYSGILSYHLNVGRNRFLAGALQSGIWQIQTNLSDLAFDAQYDGSIGFDLGRNNLEEFNNFNSTLLDLGGGILLYDTEDSWNAGFAFFHTNPVASFGYTDSELQNLNKLNIRFTLHGMLPIKIGSRSSERADYYIIRGLIMAQSPHWQSMISAERKINLFKKSTSLNYFTVGTGARFSSNYSGGLLTFDALFFSIQTDIFENFSFGLSYDINTSKLQAISKNRGGMELSMNYKFGRGSECVKCWDF